MHAETGEQGPDVDADCHNPGGRSRSHEEQGNNGRHVAEVDLVKGRHHGNGEFQGHEGAGNCSQHTGVNKFQNTPFSL